MKKILTFGAVAISLAACSSSYDYYNGAVKYIQDGKNCVFYVGENGKRFSDDVAAMAGNRKIVYRNTRCADLYARENFNDDSERNAMPVVEEVPREIMVAPSCGCNKCAARQTRYVLVSAM